MSRQPQMRPITIGDGLRFGLGLILAELLFLGICLGLWIAGLGAVLLAIHAVEG